MLIGGCASQEEATFFLINPLRKKGTVVLFSFKEAQSTGPETIHLCKRKGFCKRDKTREVWNIVSANYLWLYPFILPSELFKNTTENELNVQLNAMWKKCGGETVWEVWEAVSTAASWTKTASV